jgi:signal transduction histidine kinase
MQETIERQNFLEAEAPKEPSEGSVEKRWLGSRISIVGQIAFSAAVLASVVATGWEIRDEFQLTPLFLCLVSSVLLALFTDFSVTLAYSVLSTIAAEFLLMGPKHPFSINGHFALRLSVFVGTSLLINFLVARIRAVNLQSIEARQAAEAANREKDEIIAVLSHDLRAPLTAVQLSLQLIDHQAKGTDAIHRNVERAIEACRRINNLVLDLLDSSKSASVGGMSLQKKMNDFSKLARSVAEELRIIAAQQGIALDSSGIQDELTLNCDANRMSQLLTNLISNALKYTLRGGLVRVAVRLENGSAKLTVSDTGIGMSKEQLEHVFEKFWQAEKNARKGVGLGLFIVKAIVDAHGGTISIESEPNRGTVVAVTLPITSRK